MNKTNYAKVALLALLVADLEASQAPSQLPSSATQQTQTVTYQGRTYEIPGNVTAYVNEKHAASRNESNYSKTSSSTMVLTGEGVDQFLKDNPDLWKIG